LDFFAPDLVLLELNMPENYVTKCHPHFVERVKQRIGMHVDPAWLYYRLIDSIHTDDGFATWKTRQHDTRSIWYFFLKGERYFVVVSIEKKRIAPITILEPNFVVKKAMNKRRKPLVGTGTGALRKKRKRKNGRREP